MNKKLILLFLACAVLFHCSIAQVSVNPLTGAGSVSIPIYTLSSGQVAVPVSLSYSATGVKVKDVEGTAGMGWQLQTGGQVSRLLRGIPDDATYDNLSHFSSGWMTSSTVPYINGFSIANDNTGSCAKEALDTTYIANYLQVTNADTEPDIFYVNAPGLSCELVYDRGTAKFLPITYQDIVISYATIGGAGNNASLIASFTITNDKGIKYTFAQPEYVTQTTSKGTAGTAHYFTTKYLQYQRGVTYADSWQLTSITDPNGNGINLNYAPAPERDSNDPVLIYQGGSTTPLLQYYVYQAVTPETLSSINTFNVNNTTPGLTFTWSTYSGNGYTGQTVISSITGFGRTFQFNYADFKYTPSGYTRNFLQSFSEPGCNSPVNYQFQYIGQGFTSYYYTTSLPDSSANNVDYWGYYSTHPAQPDGSSGNLIPSVYVNPSNNAYQRYAVKVLASPGASYPYVLTNRDRSPDASVVATGTLYRIVSAQGGITHLYYEANDYVDVPSNTVVQGGGIRVHQVVDSAASTNTNTMTRTYGYGNPATGLSSGKPVTLPAYAFTQPDGSLITSQALAASATVLSAYDLSTEDHTIMYTNTSVSQTGAGKTVYQYYVPATNWDNSATPGCSGCSTAEWSPTINYSAREYCTTQPVKNDIDSYPFIPNPNYDFERGLLQKATNYNDGGTEVSETNYTYQRSFAPSFITAFKSDNNSNLTYVIKAYNKYKIYYNTSELTTQVSTKVYDSPTLTQSQTNTVNYTYGSANHKQLTQQQATNSDGSTLTTNIKYAKDYTIAAGSTNPNIAALYNMLQQNRNVPVETYQQVTRSGVTTTTGASLTLFNAYTLGAITHYLASQQFKWIQPNGAAFTPMSISGNTLIKDAGYFGVSNFDVYDNTGFPQTADDTHKHIQTTLLDHYSGQPTAVFSNAAFNEIAFSDFDTDPLAPTPPACNFAISGTKAFTPATGHAGNAYGLGTSQTVSHTLTKNALAQKYTFSIWINATTAGSLSIILNGGTSVPLSYAGNSAWTYYELPLSVSALSSPLTISFTSSQQIAIDDILFYPDVAEASTATYDALSHFKIAATNTNGVSTYFTNDTWGRMLYQFDQDKNIVRKATYVTPLNVQNFATPVITGPSTADNATPVVFSAPAYDPCTGAGLLYSWAFGDGNTYQSTANVTPSHTYATPGSYTVTLTVTSPLFGSKTATPVSITITAAVATVSSVTNHTMGSGLTSISMVTTGHSYSLLPGTFPTSIAPGTYTVTITPFGPVYNPTTGKGLNLIVFADGADGRCWSAYNGSNSWTFTYTVAAHDTITIDVYNNTNGTCPFN